MGRGDKRTFKGKVFRGSYGNARPHKEKEQPVEVEKPKAPARRAPGKR